MITSLAHQKPGTLVELVAFISASAGADAILAVAGAPPAGAA